MFYETYFYIGQPKDFPDKGMVRFKFLGHVINDDCMCNLSKKEDVSAVEKRYAFAGSIVRKAFFPYHIVGYREVTKLYKNFAKNTSSSLWVSLIFVQITFFQLDLSLIYYIFSFFFNTSDLFFMLNLREKLGAYMKSAQSKTINFNSIPFNHIYLNKNT